MKHGTLVRLNGLECIAGLPPFSALDADWGNYAILELFSHNELTGACFFLRLHSEDREEPSTILLYASI